MKKDRLKAAIIGAGRIGVGWNWKTSIPGYTHAEAYTALADRIELVGLVDPDEERARYGMTRHRIPFVASDVETMMKEVKPDVVSVCTTPQAQRGVLAQLRGRVKGIWCEKPYMGETEEPMIQVNYIRRFDARHQVFAGKTMKNANLVVIAKPDLTTMCHFVDLARWWRIPLERLHLHPTTGPCSYILRFDDDGPPGRGSESHEVYFPNGGVVGGFMKNALADLLNAVEAPYGKVRSSADPAITRDTREFLRARGHQTD